MTVVPKSLILSTGITITFLDSSAKEFKEKTKIINWIINLRMRHP
jgi:hypothetical protein